MSDDTTNADLLDLAGTIAVAYVSNNPLPAAELPGLVPSLYATLVGLGQPQSTATAEEPVDRPTPAQIKKSITPDALISFVDGKPYKILKRHLGLHGLDPYSYRQRYGLPADYPMVAANYSAQRSASAKSLGLSRLGQVKRPVGE